MLQVLTERAGLNDSRGEIEIIVRDRLGRLVERRVENNILKLFMKDAIAHRLPYHKVWDPTAGSGSGDWVSSGIDPNADRALKYILLGASFNDDGDPLNADDDRFYTVDTVTQSAIPIRLTTGATTGGSLINAIPIAEPGRPLKRIERIFFEPSYQPASSPLLQDDVRAINNVLVVETTLPTDEYNGFNRTPSDFFTITEVAICGGPELGTVGDCECLPDALFAYGSGGTDVAIAATASGAATVTIDSSETASLDVIKEGDQVKLLPADSVYGATDTFSQTSPFYLVVSKAVGGSDVTLDRTPVDSDGNAITGAIGLFKAGLQIAAHRILKSPLKKSSDYSITIRWRFIFG